MNRYGGVDCGCALCLRVRGCCDGVGGMVFFFFFQAEDGIRDWSVTGVQTCALPISLIPILTMLGDVDLVATVSGPLSAPSLTGITLKQIGRASCRERV